MSQAAYRTIILLAALLGSSELFAQGQSDDTRCLRKIDTFYIYFTAFQPSPESAGRKFCQEIPTLGKVITSIDYDDPALGKMQTEVRIIAVESWDDALNEEKDAQAKTVLQIPAKPYPQGTITVAHVFDQPGYFVEILTLETEAQTRHVLRFPFRVGMGGGLGTIVTITFVVLALGVAGYFLIQRRRGAQVLAEAEQERMIKEVEEKRKQEKQEEEQRRKEAEEKALAERRKAEEEKRRREEAERRSAAETTPTPEVGAHKATPKPETGPSETPPSKKEK